MSERKAREPVIENRAARHDYSIGDTLEVGLKLLGSEVKSVRDGKVSLAEGFVTARGPSTSSTTGPLPVAKYSALLMHSTEGKCYSLAEMRGYLGELGLTEFQFRETAVDRSIITVRKPA